jgi:hypothetical protein
MIALLSELSARHLAKNPWRSALVALGLALAVALSLAVASAAARAAFEFERLVERICGRTDLSIEAPGIGLPRDSVEGVREVRGVAHAAARVELPVQIEGLRESLLLIGVDHPADRDFPSFETPEGKPWPPPEPRDARGERNAIFLSERFASRHGLALGSPLHLHTATGPRQFIVRGMLSDSGPAAAFDGQFATMSLYSLQAELGRGHFVDRIDVALVKGADREAVETSLRDLLGPSIAIGAAERRGVWWRALVEPFRGSLRLSGSLAALGVFAGLLAVLLPRAPDGEDASPPRRRSGERVPVPVLRLAVFGVALLLAAWLPSMRGHYWLAVIALGLTFAGAWLLTPAFLVALCRTFGAAATVFGVPPRFGRHGVVRTLGRGTVNLFALLVAVASAVCIGSFIASFERTVTRSADSVGLEDLTVARGSPLLDQRQIVFAGSVAQAVEQIPGVGRVQRHRRFEQLVDERAFRLVATDTDTFIDQAAQRGKTWPLLRGAPLKRGELERGPEILLSAGAARSLAKDIGDSVTLHAPKGDIAFVVRGITEGDSTSAAGFIDRRHLLAYWGDETVDRISVYLASGHSPERVGDAIRAALGGDGAVFVTATSSLRAELIASLRPVFDQARSIEIPALGLALLAIALTLLGPRLQSNGQSEPRQRPAAVSGNATLALCVIVAGTALGVLACAVFTRAILGADSGWRIELSFPGRPVVFIGPLVVVLALPAALAAFSARSVESASE